MASAILQRATATAPSTSGRHHICHFAAFSQGCRATPARQKPGGTCSARLSHARLYAASDELEDGPGEPVYEGMFGQWRVEEEDRAEVWNYRRGLTVAALCVVAEAFIVALPRDSATYQTVQGAVNAIALLGAASLGASLALIHIYVTPIKRAIQALWACGTLGGLWLIASQGAPITEYVGAHREAVWLVGPLFAAVTGLAFKEGACYGSPECGGLFFITPALLLGHLTGWVPEAGERSLLAAFVVLVSIFAARKYTQPVKDDIGDKSVFMFQALPIEEQEELLRQRKQEWGPD